MKITEEMEEKIINCGAFDYDAAKIANVLGIERSEVELEMGNKNTQLYKLLKKGKDLFDYVIDLKLFEMAQIGDIKALEKLEQRKHLRNI